MAFVDYDFYINLYGENAIDIETFRRVSFTAEKMVCDATTGVDGKCKLKIAFPELVDDAEAVKRCICEVIDILGRVTKANLSVENNKTIASVSAGNESISYVVNGGLIGSVASDKNAQDKLIKETIETYLRGTKDKNGVNLLYRGVYPYITMI